MRWQRSSGDTPAEGPPQRQHVLLVAGLGMSIAFALVLWLLIAGTDSTSTSTTSAESTDPSNGAEIVSVESLRETASRQGAPIYWAGLPQSSELELSQPAAGRTYVRYLTDEAEAGDPRPFLTVGSYELADPAAALRRQGNQADGVLASAPRGGVVYFSRSNPRSVYLAYPGVDVEVEIFAPSFKQALELATSGEIAPVE
jgi:hypothetical protein